MSVEDKELFLVADKALDCRKYNNTETSITWEKSSIRNFLNEEFYNTAFNSDEQSVVVDTKVKNQKNLNIISGGDDGGNDTIDKVFLLAESEVYNTDEAELYGFMRDKDEHDEARCAKATKFSRAMGTLLIDNANGNRGNCQWWLRSPGYVGTTASFVNQYGISTFGYSVATTWFAVRPAMKIIQADSDIYYYAGTVCSDGTNREIEKKVKDDDEQEAQDESCAAEVDKLINAIGTVGAESKTAIGAARKAYNELSESAKAKVTGLAILEAAETRFMEIEENSNSEDKNDAPKKNDGISADNNSATTNQQTGTSEQSTTDNTTKQVTTEQPTTDSTMEQATTEQSIATPAKVKIVSVKNSKSKAVVTIWKKTKGAKGYEVQYALNKKFTKGKKTKMLSKLTLTVKKLKKGKTYYVRVRAYDTDSGGNKIYGKWSNVKKVKIKK